MDALTILSQAAGGPVGGASLNAGLLVTVVGACATAALSALIVARVLKLHRSSAARRSVGVRVEEAPARAGATAALIEPKPLHPQRAA